MEAYTNLKMAEDAFYNCFLIIDVVIRNNGSTMRAVLNHASKGARGQVLNSPKGKLDEETPEPSFLADPYDCMKVVSQHIFSIVNKSKAQRCGFTKADALQLKKYWGTQ